ncbi:hypothetical protein VCRA219O19_10083 [Vibrio crassostreae]|nr:hypothetical protein VCRA219O19_10083 [Vibrio crassostreae]
MNELSNELLIGTFNEELGVVVQLSNKLWGKNKLEVLLFTV